jgi:nucleotide-binding universal stress UspA family protein
MSYKTLMVQLELEHTNDARLEVAGNLAERFDASVIGIAAAEHSPGPYYADGAYAQQLLAEDRAQLKLRMAEAEMRFRTAMAGRAKTLEWRSALHLPTEYVAREARAADLIITGSNDDGTIIDPFRKVSASALIMRSGRPVFFVPSQASWLKLQTVMVAWKDTREARRAVLDALPLLQRASEVIVTEVAEGDTQRGAARSRVDDVVAWLGRHNVTASGIVPERAGDALDQLEQIASDQGCDVVVAGAYGHSRLSEWIFGGVTYDLLNRSSRCSFLTH